MLKALPSLSNAASTFRIFPRARNASSFAEVESGASKVMLILPLDCMTRLCRLGNFAEILTPLPSPSIARRDLQ